MTWHRRAGTLASERADVVVTPADAGWEFSGLQVFSLTADSVVTLDLGEDEAVIVPLSATDIVVDVDSQSFALAGRTGVFASVSDWLYVPRRSRVTLRGSSGEVAVCTAIARATHPVAYTPAADVPVEVAAQVARSRISPRRTPSWLPIASTCAR